MKRFFLAAFFGTLISGAGSLCQAAGLVSVHDYLAGLSTPFVAQTGNEPWTFHRGDQNGSLLGLYSAQGYGLPGQYAQFSNPGPAGSIPASLPGGSGVSDKPGIFTHTASSGYITAVYHLSQAFTFENIFIDYELVGNGNYGDGIDFTLRTIKSGAATDHGTVTMQSNVNQRANFGFGPGLALNSGDAIAVLFSPRAGSYWYDHGWWDIGFDTKTVTPPPQPDNRVPDSASTLLMALGGLAALACFKRKG